MGAKGGGGEVKGHRNRRALAHTSAAHLSGTPSFSSGPTAVLTTMRPSIRLRKSRL